MRKFYNIYGIFAVCIASLQLTNAHSSEVSLSAKVGAQVRFDDNIFLTTGPHESVTGIVITPSLLGSIKEKHWQAKLDARLRNTNYSDESLDSNEQFFNLTGNYNAERDIYSLAVRHVLYSSLNSGSQDFAVSSRRVTRKTQTISPQYRRLLSKRSSLAINYNYTDVSFLDAESTNFVPFVSQTGSASITYNLTEIDSLTLSLTRTDFVSKDNLNEFQLLVSRFALNHNFSETLSTYLSIGVSRRNTTSLNTVVVDFFGNFGVKQQEVDVESRGLVLNLAITQILERGQISGQISRDDRTNSFGTIDQVDQLQLNYSEKLSALWQYSLGLQIEGITSVSSNSIGSDRDVLLLNTALTYSITQAWSASASYRYAQRKFKTDESESRAPHSNRFYLGLTYNFPPLLTF